MPAFYECLLVVLFLNLTIDRTFIFVDFILSTSVLFCLFFQGVTILPLPVMMRVHLRGVVIGVGVVLSIVILVSLVNTFDAPRTRRGTRNSDEDGAGGAAERPQKGARSKKHAPKARNRFKSPQETIHPSR